MASINLAPGTEYIIAARKRRQRLYGISVGIIVLFAIGFAVLFFIQQSLTTKNDDLKVSIQTATDQIHQSQLDATRVLLFEKRLRETARLLDAHINWNPVFADIERLLPPTTVLTSVEAGSNSNVIIINGATPDIDTIAQAIASLSASANHPSIFKNGSLVSVKKVDVKNGEQTVSSYTFNITLTLDPATLRASAV